MFAEFAARSHDLRRVLPFFLPLLAMLVAPSVATASIARPDYRLELVLETEELTEAFVHVSPLDRRDFYAFELIRRDRLREELDLATRALARRLGYDADLYGEDYYKLVRVDRWSYRLVDVETDRVVDEGRGFL